tara:strand:- start:2433 stop:2936 length:504 start_codon:yes stop_codon:yes gene_type:complete
MKIVRYIVFVTFISTLSIAQANSNIVYIDIDFLIKNSNIGKASLDKLETLNKKNINKLNDRETELKKNETDLKNKQNIISADQFNKEVNLLKEKIKLFNSEKDKMVNDFNKIKVKEINNVMIKFNTVIQLYMDQNSIDVVLDKKNIFIGKVSSDITKIILKEINTKF